jgi:hypothetical protein
VEAVSPAFLANTDYVPQALGDLLNEADGCLESGFLTGGTACARRALDLLLSVAKTKNGTYDEGLASLGERHGVPKVLTNILTQCGNASASDGAKFSAEVLQLFVVTMRAVVYELYVLGPERAERLQYVSALVKAVEHKLPADPSTTSKGANRETEANVALQW